MVHCLKKPPRQDLGLCGFSFPRDSEKSFTAQIYRTLYGDAMLVPFRGAPTWRPQQQLKHLPLSFAIEMKNYYSRVLTH